MDICFIGAEGTAGFLRKHIPDAFTPGDIVYVDGKKIGDHQGVGAFTIGQRKGLGVAWHEPLYVVDINVDTNVVTLGPKDSLLVREALLRDCTWHLGPLPVTGLRCSVRNRYRCRPAAATIFPCDKGARVVYDEPCTKPSAGQACVAYSDDGQLCLGGGWFVKN